jgi:hypothetical protein
MHSFIVVYQMKHRAAYPSELATEGRRDMHSTSLSQEDEGEASEFAPLRD